jgi:O-antigen/teichoic acid export membrane protein
MLTLPYAAVTAVTLAACALLVPAHGLYGAAWAVAISGAAACASALWILYWLRRKERPRSEKGPETSQ